MIKVYGQQQRTHFNSNSLYRSFRSLENYNEDRLTQTPKLCCLFSYAKLARWKLIKDDIAEMRELVLN